MKGILYQNSNGLPRYHFMGQSNSLLDSRANLFPSIFREALTDWDIGPLFPEGTVPNYAELAHYASVTRARISQIMNLLNLAPAIQEKFLFLPTTDAVLVTERSLQRIASISYAAL